MKPPRRVELQLAHRVEQAAVHRLQPVAHIGQRAVHDGRERVGEIALFERILQLDRLDGCGSENRIVSHGGEVAGLALGLKGASGLIGKETLACSRSSERLALIEA